MKQHVQRLQFAVTEQQTIWDSITLVVALDSLHDDFELITSPLLHLGDKNIMEIQQIVTSTKTANLAKRAVGAIANLTMMAKKKQPERSDLRQNEKCFKYGRKGHYAKDCHNSTHNFTKRKSVEEFIEEAKRSRWKKNQAKAAKSTANNDDFDVETYPAGRAFMTREADEEREWYLDSCASRHICNNHEKFVDLRPKTYEFITAGGNIIRSSQIGTITLLLENSSKLTLTNVVYTPEYDSKLISLGQLRETGISYHDHAECMVLKQEGKTIGLAIRRKNLFILNTQIAPSKTMLVKGRGRPTYRLSSNPQVGLWHRRFGYASNARVIQASKLVDGIDFGEPGPVDESQSSDFESCDSNDEAINKAIKHNFEDVEELCEACIESKHTRIVKLKKMTPASRKLQEVHAEL